MDLLQNYISDTTIMLTLFIHKVIGNVITRRRILDQFEHVVFVSRVINSESHAVMTLRCVCLIAIAISTRPCHLPAGLTRLFMLRRGDQP